MLPLGSSMQEIKYKISEILFSMSIIHDIFFSTTCELNCLNYDVKNNALM